MKRKLSDRAIVILSVIINKTTDDGGFWIPDGFASATSDWSPEFRDFANISGAGDCAILRGLERSGFIRRPKTTLNSPYLYRATEEGILAYESNRSRFEEIETNLRRDWNRRNGVKPAPPPDVCDDSAYFQACEIERQKTDSRN